MPKKGYNNPEKYNLPFVLVSVIFLILVISVFVFYNLDLPIAGYAVKDLSQPQINSLEVKKINIQDNEALVLIENNFNENLMFDFNLIAKEQTFYYKSQDIIQPYYAKWIKFSIPSNLVNLKKLEVIPYSITNKTLRKFTVMLG